MSIKKAKISLLIEQWQNHGVDPHYFGYFHCFNRGFFFEAHDVLEQLWLEDRHGANGAFYKGLIQFAGAFVHLQKNRLRPSAALFKLALANFAKYPPHHEHLDMKELLAMSVKWIGWLEAGEFKTNPLTASSQPHMSLAISGRRGP